MTRVYYFELVVSFRYLEYHRSQLNRERERKRDPPRIAVLREKGGPRVGWEVILPSRLDPTVVALSVPDTSPPPLYAMGFIQ
jgi:hypothetical protein